MSELDEENSNHSTDVPDVAMEEATNCKKKPKRGIIYLSTIPPYMNVTQIREYFGDFGKIGRVYLQLANTEPKGGSDKPQKKQRKIAKKFAEGWIEFERKSVAKRVAKLLNNTQVSQRKKSRHYDMLWNIKYLSNFKWVHLHERLAYEKAARRQKLRAEVQLAKKKTNFFTLNLDNGKKNKPHANKDIQEAFKETNSKKPTVQEEPGKDDNNREEFLQSLFN